MPVGRSPRTRAGEVASPSDDSPPRPPAGMERVPRPADISAGMAGIMLVAADTAEAIRMLDLLVDALLAR